MGYDANLRVFSKTERTNFHNIILKTGSGCANCSYVNDSIDFSTNILQFSRGEITITKLIISVQLNSKKNVQWYIDPIC